MTHFVATLLLALILDPESTLCPAQVQDDAKLEGLVERLLDDRDPDAEQELRKAKDAGRIIVQMIKGGHEKVCPLIGLLGRLEARDAEDSLAGFLTNPEPTVRVAAAWSLGKIKSKKSVDSIMALLKDGQLNDRQKSSAAQSLGEIGDTKAIVLLKAFQDDLVARGLKTGFPFQETVRALTKLEILAIGDVVQREKRLADLLLKNHQNAEELQLRLWAAERLADDQRTDSVSFIRSVLTQEAGDEGLQREVKVRLLAAIFRLKGHLSSAELDLLKGEGIVK